MELDSAPLISGAVVRDQLLVMRSLYGDVHVDGALDALPAAQRDELRSLTTLTWCTIGSVNAVKLELARRADVDPNTLQKKVVRTALERTMTTLWRFVVRQLSDESLLKRTPLIYARAYNRGELALVRSSEGSADFSVRGWRDIGEYDCLGLGTGVETVLILSGRKHVHVTWQRAHVDTRFLATWRNS